MLEKSKSVLLLSDVESFGVRYTALAESVGVFMETESSWGYNYRVKHDTIILGSKFLPYLNKAYYPKAVLLLKKDESPFPFVKEGIKRFIFNYQNDNELVFALFKAEVKLLYSTSIDLKDIIKDSAVTDFIAGDYDFKFDRNVFKYKGKRIYLAESHKKYLAEWLLHGIKDNKKRMVLCNLRKKFGSEFLKDINRFGEVKEDKNEQSVKKS